MDEKKRDYEAEMSDQLKTIKKNKWFIIGFILFVIVMELIPWNFYSDQKRAEKRESIIQSIQQPPETTLVRTEILRRGGAWFYYKNPGMSKAVTEKYFTEQMEKQGLKKERKEESIDFSYAKGEEYQIAFAVDEGEWIIQIYFNHK